MAIRVLLFCFLQATAPIGDRFAGCVAAGSDLDADGIADLVIADSTQLGAGVVWIVSGRDGSVIDERTFSGELWGPCVDLVGDVDSDRVSDIAVAVNDLSADGFVAILSGKTRSRLLTIRGDDLGVRIGRVRAAGLVDEGACPDLVVVGFERTEPWHRFASVLVVSGKDGHVARKLASNLPISQFSLASGIGDLDGDGRNDIAVGRSEAGGGRVDVYSGWTGKRFRAWSTGTREPDFGASIDGGMDFDGDSMPDVLVGSPQFGTPRSADGRVHVFSGCDGTLIATFEGLGVRRHDLGAPDHFGECAMFLGDVDADGVPELLVGSPEEGLSEGAAHLYSGRTGWNLRSVHGEARSTRTASGDYHVGRGIARAGDVDRDGVEDFVVVNDPYDRGQCGLVRIFSGRIDSPTSPAPPRELLSVDRAMLLRISAARSKSR